jgi:hypothetical protein
VTGISRITSNDEIVNSSYVQSQVTVGTSQIEAKVGASKLSGRQALRIYNSSNTTIYFGPSGVTTSTGEPIEKKQWLTIAVGDQLAVFLIAGSAGNNVIVSEWA